MCRLESRFIIIRFCKPRFYSGSDVAGALIARCGVWEMRAVSFWLHTRLHEKCIGVTGFCIGSLSFER